MTNNLSWYETKYNLAHVLEFSRKAVLIRCRATFADYARARCLIHDRRKDWFIRRAGSSSQSKVQHDSTLGLLLQLRGLSLYGGSFTVFYRITRGGGPTTYLHYEILVKYKIWIFSFLDRYNWLNKFSVDEPAKHQLFMMLIFNN